MILPVNELVSWVGHPNKAYTPDLPIFFFFLFFFFLFPSVFINFPQILLLLLLYNTILSTVYIESSTNVKMITETKQQFTEEEISLLPFIYSKMQGEKITNELLKNVTKKIQINLCPKKLKSCPWHDT